MAAAAALLAGGWLSALEARAAGLGTDEVVAGLRSALEKGAGHAVAALGRTDGFLGNPKVRIPLPDWMKPATRVLKLTGQGKRLDELETTMNRAAEAAVPQAGPLLIDAVKGLSIDEAQAILRGGDTAATDHFAKRTRDPLSARFLPVVTEATDRLSLARQVNALMSKAGKAGLVKEPRSVEQHVTGKALDGLFLMMGEEERKLRADPGAAASDLLRRVFGRG
jgi:hypothetical protein